MITRQIHIFHIFTILVDENGEKLDAPAKKCDRIVVCDPNHTEEAIMDGKLVLGMNPYKEICTLHLAGKMIIDKVLFHIGSMRLRSNLCFILKITPSFLILMLPYCTVGIRRWSCT